MIDSIFDLPVNGSVIYTAYGQVKIDSVGYMVVNPDGQTYWLVSGDNVEDQWERIEVAYKISNKVKKILELEGVFSRTDLVINNPNSFYAIETLRSRENLFAILTKTPDKKDDIGLVINKEFVGQN